MMAARCPTAARVSAQPRRVSAVPHRRVAVSAEKAEKAPWTEPTLDPNTRAAIMRSGPNMMKLARKEQCLALTTQLRNKFKTDACFYRVFPNGEVQYLHPLDGVYPEKVNKG